MRTFVCECVREREEENVCLCVCVCVCVCVVGLKEKEKNLVPAAKEPSVALGLVGCFFIADQPMCLYCDFVARKKWVLFIRKTT